MRDSYYLTRIKSLGGYFKSDTPTPVQPASVQLTDTVPTPQPATASTSVAKAPRRPKQPKVSTILKPPKLPPSELQEKKIQERRAYHQKYKESMRQQGLGINCGHPLEGSTNANYCSNCNEKDKERLRQKYQEELKNDPISTRKYKADVKKQSEDRNQAAGLGRECGHPLGNSPSIHYCLECLEKYNVKKREARKHDKWKPGRPGIGPKEPKHPSQVAEEARQYAEQLKLQWAEKGRCLECGNKRTGSKTDLCRRCQKEKDEGLI